MSHNILEIKGDLKLYSKNGTTSTNIFDLIYPVGSVILTRDKNFKPANVYGGEWVAWTDGYIKCDTQAETDKSGNTSYPIKDIYNNEISVSTSATTRGNYLIREDLLPNHTHTFSVTSETEDASVTHPAIALPVDTNNILDAVEYDAQNRFPWRAVAQSSEAKYYGIISPAVTGDHSHELSISGTTNDDTDKFSGNNFKPKYYAVIAWQRTA